MHIMGLTIVTPLHDVTRFAWNGKEFMYYNKERNKVIILNCVPPSVFYPFKMLNVDNGEYVYFWTVKALTSYCETILAKYGMHTNGSTEFKLT